MAFFLIFLSACAAESDGLLSDSSASNGAVTHFQVRSTTDADPHSSWDQIDALNQVVNIEMSRMRNSSTAPIVPHVSFDVAGTLDPALPNFRWPTLREGAFDVTTSGAFVSALRSNLTLSNQKVETQLSKDQTGWKQIPVLFKIPSIDQDSLPATLKEFFDRVDSENLEFTITLGKGRVDAPFLTEPLDSKSQWKVAIVLRKIDLQSLKQLQNESCVDYADRRDEAIDRTWRNCAARIAN